MFTNNKFKFNITWSTRKIRSLFPLKDRVKHVSCVIYHGVCSCGETYIGETERIAEGRLSEHNAPSKNSEPAKCRTSYYCMCMNCILLYVFRFINIVMIMFIRGVFLHVYESWTILVFN